MELFKSKKTPKKRVYKKIVMHKDGISNFPTDDSVEIAIDEINECLTFTYRQKRTATLPFSKITGLELGEKGNTIAGNSTQGAIAGAVIGGATGAVIGSTAGKRANFIPTLRIKYMSAGEEKEINLYQCNYHSEGSIDFVKTMIQYNLPQNDAESHLEL